MSSLSLCLLFFAGGCMGPLDVFDLDSTAQGDVKMYLYGGGFVQTDEHKKNRADLEALFLASVPEGKHILVINTAPRTKAGADGAYQGYRTRLAGRAVYQIRTRHGNPATDGNVEQDDAATLPLPSDQTAVDAVSSASVGGFIVVGGRTNNLRSLVGSPAGNQLQARIANGTPVMASSAGVYLLGDVFTWKMTVERTRPGLGVRPGTVFMSHVRDVNFEGHDPVCNMAALMSDTITRGVGAPVGHGVTVIGDRVTSVGSGAVVWLADSTEPISLSDKNNLTVCGTDPTIWGAALLGPGQSISL